MRVRSTLVLDRDLLMEKSPVMVLLTVLTLAGGIITSTRLGKSKTKEDGEKKKKIQTFGAIRVGGPDRRFSSTTL